MTLQECYAALDGDYEGVAGRLRSDRLVQKFILKFLEDPSYGLLVDSMDREDFGEAFRAAHTIKGVCQNLDFTRLYRSSSRLCEALRHGFTPEAPGCYGEVRADYQQTVDAIGRYRAELEAQGGA